MQKVTIPLDRVRSLKYNFNAIAAFDEINKVPLQYLSDNDYGSFAVLRNLLWAGLILEDPDLTHLQVGSMIQAFWIDKDKGLAEILSIIRQAMARDFPSEEEQQAKKKSAKTKKKAATKKKTKRHT